MPNPSVNALDYPLSEEQENVAIIVGRVRGRTGQRGPH